MDSAREVLSSMGAPVDFEEMYLSEVKINQTFKLAQCLLYALGAENLISTLFTFQIHVRH